MRSWWNEGVQGVGQGLQQHFCGMSYVPVLPFAVLTLHLKPGQLCTPTGTAAEIRAQFVTALNSGVSQKIKKSVSSTGVKDTTTGYILEAIVEMGKKLRKRVAGVQPKPESEVQAILKKELEDHLHGSVLDDAINPLLGVAGQYLNRVAHCAPTDLR
jgi:hypothetical protein